MRPKIFNRLSIKLIVVISAVLLIILGIYTYLTISKLNKDLSEACQQNAYNISDIIRKSTRYSMLLNRSDDIYQIINTIGTEKGVEKIRIYNKEGEISYSSDSTEINKRVDLGSEACYVCHADHETPSELPIEKMIRKFKSAEGNYVIGLINPIRNEHDCYSADCHAHDPEKRILGVLDIIISTETVDNIIDSNIRNTIFSSIVVTVLIALFAAIFIGVFVNTPLTQFSRGIDEIARGNLDYSINIKSGDELGLMADEFNQMSEKLRMAYNEIKDWSENLNEKVQQKNEELKKIYEQITQIEKLTSLGKLSATVAHELNNPLEGILTYSKLISRKLEKLNNNADYSEVQKFLGLIYEETARCGKICNDLLLFSHSEDGIFEQYDFIEIIEKSLTLINHHFEINKINVEKKYFDDKFILDCNSQKIEQALVAVFINAAESMPDGGTLTLTLAKEDGHAFLRITDQGMGISEEDLPYIFEPFYSTKSKSKGTGLGLSVAYGIIEQHNGKIYVEETSIKGTTFRINLPLKQLNQI